MFEQSDESEPLMSSDSANGLITIPSNHSVHETVHRISAVLLEKGILIFARIDHSGEAAKVGLQMPNTKLLIFGSPKGGTPLMQAAPSVAIDLPLKALIAEDADGKVWLTYNDPAYLQSRHGFPAELEANLAGAIALLRKALE